MQTPSKALAITAILLATGLMTPVAARTALSASGSDLAMNSDTDLSSARRGGGGGAHRAGGGNRNVNRANVNRTNVKRTNVNVNRARSTNVNVRKTNVRVGVGARPVRGWARRPYYGTVVGGVALGTIIAATAVPTAPAPNMCWFWSDSTNTRGYWDYCNPP